MIDFLIFGGTGRLGREFIRQLKETDFSFEAPPRSFIDLAGPTFPIRQIIRQREPKVIVNCAAFNGIEQVEERPGAAFSVNVSAVAEMAAAARETGAMFVHYSTDYTIAQRFWQDAPLIEGTPYSFTSLYGTTKTLGEVAIQQIAPPHYLVFRLSSIYGDDLAGALDPVRQALAGKGTLGSPIKVLQQICAPTSVRTIADTTLQILAELSPHDMHAASGIYNMVNDGAMWKTDFAKLAVNAFLDKTVWVTEGQLQHPRPQFCILTNDKLKQVFDVDMPLAADDVLEEAQRYKESRDGTAHSTGKLH